MFGFADNDTTILHNVLGLDKNIATVHMLDFSLLVLVGGGKDSEIHKMIICLSGMEVVSYPDPKGGSGDETRMEVTQIWVTKELM